jgi:hypothetical protein
MAGSRGIGKTTVMVKFVSEYNKSKTFDRIYIVSPSYLGDPKYKVFETFDTQLHIYHTYSDSIMREIIADIEDGIEAHKSYLKKKALYKKWLADQKDLKDFSGKELRTLENMDHTRPKPPFKRGKSPVSLLIFDDCMATSLYKSHPTNPATSFFYRHRHMATSVIFVCQAVKSGVPRQLRANLSFLVLFRCKSKHMADEIAEEFSSYVSVEEFEAMWMQATVEPYTFFYVDFEDKKHPYRICFDKAFILPKKGNVSKPISDSQSQAAAPSASNVQVPPKPPATHQTVQVPARA